MSVNFYEIGTLNDSDIQYVVISSRHNNKHVYVRHKERTTWEMPGGGREINETLDDTARRELVEETGAKKFKIYPLCECSVIFQGKLSYGKLYYSVIDDFEELPDLEIGEVKLFDNIPSNLTYHEIQPVVHKKAMEMIRKLNL